MGYVWLAIGIFLLAAGAAVVWKYNSAIERAVEAEQRAAVAEEAVKAYEVSYNALKDQYKKLDDSLRKKSIADIKIRKELNDVQAQLEELKRKDPAVMDWANQPVPNAVVELLRDKPVAPADKGNGGSSGAKGSHLGDPGSTGGAVTIRPN